jgi:serine/threonine-protein kinase
MATATAASGERVLADLTKCSLLKNEHLELAREFLRRNPSLGGRELTDYLVSKNLLARNQADELWAVYEQRLTVWGYTLGELLGRGSLGIVYKATLAGDDREYAVKALPRRSVGSVSRLAQRLQPVLHFEHPAVAPLVHAGTAADKHYLVWPYVPESEPLEALVRRDGPLAPKHAVHYALQVVRGLRALHAQELFHGLLKPSNLLVGPGHTAVLTDLGVGFLLTLATGESLLNTLTTTSLLSGFVDFASPESIIDPTQRTALGDQYSLGCVLYFCLTGQVPFPQEPVVKKMMAQQSEEPVPLRDLNPEVPPRLADLVAKLMAKAPEGRYPSMAEVEEALQDLLPRTPALRMTPLSPTPPPPPSPSGSRPVARPGPAPAPPPAPMPRPDEAAPTPGRVVSLIDIALPKDGARRPAARQGAKRPELSPVVWMVVAAVAGVLAWLAGTYLFG